MGFSTLYDTNMAVESQKMVRGLKFFGFAKKKDCTIYVARTKPPISCMVTVQLICAFVFAYAKAGFLMTQLTF